MQNTADLNEHFRLCLLHPLQVLGLMRGRGCGHTAQFQQPIGPGRSWGSRTRWWPAHWEGGIHKVISTLSVSWTPTTMAISDSTYSDMSHIKWSQMNLAYVWCVLSIHKCFVLTEIQCPKATQLIPWMSLEQNRIMHINMHWSDSSKCKPLYLCNKCVYLQKRL